MTRKVRKNKQTCRAKSRFLSWAYENRWALIVFAIYLIITLVAVLFHENWEDEAQAWLTARDCSPVEVFERMSMEGHFAPWYFILMPFAKLGLPYKTMNVVSWLITVSAAWLILKNLPCKFYKRVIIIFTFPMLYLYPAISRCYCLLPLGVILAIMFYKNRFKKPLRYLFSVFIIANVHTHTIVFALVMGVEYLVDWIKIRKKLDRKQNALIMSGITSVILLVGFSCLPLIGSVGATSKSTSGLQVLLYENPLKQLFVYTPINFFRWFTGPLAEPAYVAGSFLIAWGFFNRKSVFFKIAASCIWQWAITTFLFTLIVPQRVMIVVFVMLFFVSCKRWRPKESDVFSKSGWKWPIVLSNIAFIAIAIWLEIDTGNMVLAFIPFFSIVIFGLAFLANYKNVSFRNKLRKCGHTIAMGSLLFLALLNVWIGITWVKEEIEKPYSDALATANYINNNIDDDSVFLTFQESSMFLTAIIPDLRVQDNRFYSVRRHEFYTYTVYLTPDKTQLAISDIVWSNYCHLSKKLYYLGISADYYGKGIFDPNISLEPTMALEENETLTKIFDLYEGASPTEHYAIFELNPDICKNEK